MASRVTIKQALNKETGEIIIADRLFNNRELGFDYRREYNRKKITPVCLSCGNKLVVSSSKYDKIYFKHLPESEYCELKDSSITAKDRDIYTRIFASKESKRHNFLKNRIGELLRKEQGVENILIDNKFIFNSRGEKKKPDLYFTYNQKEIVFEIQLSDLSQKYILSRYDFYKEKGIYLIWILDNFDVLGSSQTEKDIKHLSKHQNYFRFEDASKVIKLNCRYKQPYLSNDEIFEKWREVNISLDKLIFDEINKEIYFYNSKEEKSLLEKIKEKNKISQEEKKQREKKLRYKNEVEKKILSFINLIVEEKDRSYKSDFSKLKISLRDFKEDEIDLLNKKLKLNTKNKIKILNWFEECSENDYNFLEFILTLSPYIEIDVNGINEKGNGVLYFLFKNDKLSKDRYLILLFKAGFKFSEKDRYLLNDYSQKYNQNIERINIIFNLANIVPKHLIKDLFDTTNQKVICILESCLKKKIIGFRFNSWIALLNYAIHNFSEYWVYIDKSLKKDDLLEEVIYLDKKKSFQKKLNIHYNTSQSYNMSFLSLFKELYPEFSN